MFPICYSASPALANEFENEGDLQTFLICHSAWISFWRADVGAPLAGALDNDMAMPGHIHRTIHVAVTFFYDLSLLHIKEEKELAFRGRI